jgi:hypothetical protein
MDSSYKSRWKACELGRTLSADERAQTPLPDHHAQYDEWDSHDEYYQRDCYEPARQSQVVLRTIPVINFYEGRETRYTAEIPYPNGYIKAFETWLIDSTLICSMHLSGLACGTFMLDRVVVIRFDLKRPQSPSVSHLHTYTVCADT